MDSKQHIKELARQISSESDVIKLRKLIQEFQFVASESNLQALNHAFHLSITPVRTGICGPGQD